MKSKIPWPPGDLCRSQTMTMLPDLRRIRRFQVTVATRLSNPGQVRQFASFQQGFDNAGLQSVQANDDNFLRKNTSRRYEFSFGVLLEADGCTVAPEWRKIRMNLKIVRLLCSRGSTATRGHSPAQGHSHH
jgi:hypothetical protein